MLTKINSYSEYYSNLQPEFQVNPKSSFKNYYHETIGLGKRLYIQIKRRPINLIAGLIQPLIWLILFGALFQKMMITVQIPYNKFLNTGIITFTSFTSAMNAGLPIIFDREFGFFNRLLVSPLQSKYSILISSILSITLITLFQTYIIITFNLIILKYQYSIYQLISIFYITVLLTITISNISICLAFILPGHIEFLALVLISNLPVLFSSTALAPLSFMPHWLQIMTHFNPMTYAIEMLRFILIHNINQISSIESTLNSSIYTHICQNISIFLFINVINFILSKYIITYKCE